MKRPRIKRPRLRRAEQVRTIYFPLYGGEDLVTPPLTINPGALLFSLNYEPAVVHGYRRIDGFERCDGRPKPSAASYWVLNYDGGTAAFSVGETVTGGTSAATGKVLVVSGTTASGYLVLYGVTGTFQDNEAITSAGGAAVANGTATQRGASNDTDDATWLQAAVAATRAAIQAPAGTGQIRGVWPYKGVRYTFRNNAGGTACVMYKSTPSGWAAVDLGRKLDFTSGGTTAIAEGNTITGATSGATALIKRVVVTSGSWGADTAAGYFVFASQTGTFQAENLNVGALLNLATIAGNSATITLSPSGRYEFENHNFYGSAATIRMYGCDGINKGFEFDGDTFCPVTTGMAVDKPVHLAAHSKHLFFSFANGAIQYSSMGFPLTWSVLIGAAQLGTGGEITGMQTVPGGVLSVFNRNQTYLLYGTSSADFQVKKHATDSGAVEWSIQPIGSPRYLDDRGLTSLEAVQAYGDFAASTFSQQIQPLLKELMAGTTVTASVRVRSKDQYRIFFADGTGIIAKFRGNKVEFTRINYGKVVRCACSVEDENGRETLLFGSDDGYVYEMDAGTSFDGAPIEAYLRLPFGSMKSPSQLKRYLKIILELDAPNGCALEFTQEYDYGNADNPRGLTQSLNVQGGGGFWGIDKWSTFLWSSQVAGTATGYLDGLGVNIGFVVRSYATHEQPHTINGATIHYAMRGRNR